MPSCRNIQKSSGEPPQMSSEGQQRSSSKTQPASCPRCHSAACCCCSQHMWAPGLAAHCTSLLAAAVPARLLWSGTPQLERTFPLARCSLQHLAPVMCVWQCLQCSNALTVCCANVKLSHSCAGDTRVLARQSRARQQSTYGL